MKLLIFGSTGRTGQRLCLAARHAGHTLDTPSRTECNLQNPETVWDYVRRSEADAVINCAAISGLEACLDAPDTARRINSLAPEAMAQACRCTGARMIHLSTDYVLEGSLPGLHDENSPCAPLSVYASSKLEGESRVTEAHADSAIIRVSWICGNPNRPGFIESAVARALAGEPLAAIADKTSLPTHADDLAHVLLAMVASPASGLFHVCSIGAPLSWRDCALLALNALVEDGQLPTLPDVTPQQLSTVPFFRDPRPRHTAMSTIRFPQETGITMPRAEDAIARAARQHVDFLATCTKTLVPTNRN